MSTSFIGVDAGGTRTRTLLATEEGEILGTGEAAGANSWSSGTPVAAVVTEAIGEALVGQDPTAVAGGVIAIAGGASTSPQIAAELAEGWTGLGLAASPTVVVDVLASYAAATVEPEGVVLSAGTGAIAAAVRDRRIARRADGHGWLVGDGGSAVWLGVQGTRHALMAIDGRGQATVLAERIPAALGVSVPEAGWESARGAGSGVEPGEGATARTDELIRAVYSRPPAELGRLAPVVVEASERGDVVAVRLVELAADELDRTVAAVAPGQTPRIIVLAGSLLTMAPPIGRRVRARLGQRWADVPIAEAASAEAGAVALAIGTARGESVTEAVLGRLRG